MSNYLQSMKLEAIINNQREKGILLSPVESIAGMVKATGLPAEKAIDYIYAQKIQPQHTAGARL